MVPKWLQNGCQNGSRKAARGSQKATWGPCTVPRRPAQTSSLGFCVLFCFCFCVLLFLFHVDDDVDDDVHDDDFDVNDVDDDVDNDVDDDDVVMVIIISRPRLHKRQQSATLPATAQDASSTDFGLPRKPQNAPRLPHDEPETLQDAPKTPQDD